MKKVYSLLIVLLSLSFVPKTNASHVIGGGISWDCLNDGRYIFKMQFYTECTGISWTYNNIYIRILGSPLPKNINNSSISTIVLKPDSSKWVLNKKGDKNPKCGFNDLNSNSLSCSNGDKGTIRIYYYRSDTITLKGTPPQGGWDFFYTPPCCISNRENINSTTLALRSTMYPNASNQAIDSCYDSSPKFAQAPWSMFCRGDSVNLNISAHDADFDSIVYSFDSSLYDQNNAARYAAGYSYLNPTPDTSFDSSNVASTLDANTGRLNFKINNGGGETNYQLAIKADSYREGVKIASVTSERTIKMMDCPPISSSQTNSSPIIFMGSSQNGRLDLHVMAGDKITVPISVNDTDFVGSNFQSVRSTFSSMQFSADFIDTAACKYPPCAILKSKTPSFDTIGNEYFISGLGSVATTFEWQTDCSHILDGDSIGVYYFYLSTQDDFCPIPDKKDAYLKVVVEPLISSGIQNVNYTLKSLDTVQSYQWYNCKTDSIIVGANASTYTPNQNGNYAVIIQNGSCRDTSACYNLTTVGLNENHFQNTVDFYPNPTKGTLSIETGAIHKSLQIKIRNIHGQLVQEEQFVNQRNLQLQLNGKPGIYFIELVNEHGEWANVKVVKR